jgi:hypothetical protein
VVEEYDFHVLFPQLAEECHHPQVLCKLSLVFATQLKGSLALMPIVTLESKRAQIE